MWFRGEGLVSRRSQGFSMEQSGLSLGLGCLGLEPSGFGWFQVLRSWYGLKKLVFGDNSSIQVKHFKRD